MKTSTVVSVLVLSALGMALQGPRADWLKYSDPGGRFSFSYPASFGPVSRGTNSGFGDRVSAVRFAAFSSGVRAGAIVLGGEAVVTKGFPCIDLQAVGGLYDSIAIEALSRPMQQDIITILPALSFANFCEQLRKAQHIDASDPRLATLTSQQRKAVASLDQLGNVDPNVLRCDVSGGIVIFHKQSAFSPTAPQSRRHVYGAVRFLKPPFSSFQIIRATADAPSDEMLQTIAAVVESFR